MANEQPAPLEPSWAVSLAAWSVASAGFSASTSVRAFAVTWSSSVARLINIAKTVRVGAVLPEEGVTYYDVPPEYGVRDYRYTVVNNRTVLVDPRTHRIVEVVE
jgi:hypothetical protein